MGRGSGGHRGSVTLDESSFRYDTTCSIPDCTRPPRHKVAASWSYGPLRELKNYGLACDEHRDGLLEVARSRRDAVAVRDDEVVGPVEVFPYDPPRRP